MKKADRPEVANLIYLSTNTWYRARLGHAIFSGGPEVCELFCEVYEGLDPGFCLLAEHSKTGIIAGSCFYHPRETHVSLGIMNVHPNYFGNGVARLLLRRIAEYAREEGLPLRLVSSALNLDSFSLYTREGFVPTALYQDMFLEVPESGLDPAAHGIDASRVREATLDDITDIGAVEFEVCGISRERDYRHFIENEAGIWTVLVSPSRTGADLDGYLVSVRHPGCNMIGPGAARDADTAAALIVSQLNRNAGRRPVFLVPADNRELVAKMYALGARNCELHFSQVLGESQPVRGVVMPTFMPETG
ncbi:MAG: GNAT family N-acetyltransferase [Verrucomicrobiae bacterium]|nr:GNAT family N-acetyltransferase [Verrucomicrobiae bacterium]MCP5542152.1 GNAT family N-acetyltransferase [Akkermansiaceae bacterium]